MRGLLPLAFVAACAGEPSRPVASTEPPVGAIANTTTNGPVEATIRVWPPEPRLGDPIHLRLAVTAADGVTVDLPFQEDALGRFAVTAYDRSERRDGDRQVQVQDYELQADSSGRHRIPPLRLEMLDGRDPAAKAAPVEVLTEEIPLTVAPIDAAKTDAPLPPPRGALDPEIGGWPWWAWIGAALGGVWLVLGILVFRRLRSRRSVRRMVSAYDAAVARLRALEARGAPDGDESDAWFVELSSVVRRYLEGRYDIRAPELTTEEFLLIARASRELTDDHRTLLSSFMERCDRVKFAAWRPGAEESLDTLRAARAFVEDTRLRAEGAMSERSERGSGSASRRRAP